MKDYRKIAFHDSIEYSTLDIKSWEDAEKSPAGYSSNWEKIAWRYNNIDYQIPFQKGTLTRDFVSPDGRYLVLVFNTNNSEFKAPCNLAVYSTRGELVHLICAPNLSNPEIFEKFGGKSDMQGRFTGGGIQMFDDKELMVIGVSYDDIKRPSGSFSYTEGRTFDPETGVLGDIISWELPYR